MGIVDPSDRILRLCPVSEDRLQVHYYFPSPRGLGRWVGSREQVSSTNAPLSLVPGLIGAFYKGSHDGILAHIRSSG